MASCVNCKGSFSNDSQAVFCDRCQEVIDYKPALNYHEVDIDEGLLAFDLWQAEQRGRRKSKR